jgi:hypothetical protein
LFGAAAPRFPECVRLAPLTPEHFSATQDEQPNYLMIVVESLADAYAPFAPTYANLPAPREP